MGLQQRKKGQNPWNTMSISSERVSVGTERIVLFVLGVLNVAVLLFSHIRHNSLEDVKEIRALDQLIQSPAQVKLRSEHHDEMTDFISTCSGRHRMNMAHPSQEPKISQKKRVEFIRNGGYEKIAKGSGLMHAAGPILQTLSQVQAQQLNIYGSVGEMGVHHGRFTSFLFMTARSTEQMIAVDLFEDLQESNVDLSGMGDYRKFVQGMEIYGVNPNQENFRVIKSSTSDLPLDFATDDASLQGFRLWSIDAGHTAELTRRDFTLVFCNLLPGGIAVLDDWFHPHWPGVVEGFYQFANDMDHQPQNRPLGDGVYPFLLCEAKLYVTNDKVAHELYLNSLVNDPVLGQWMSTNARVGNQRAGRTWPYQMVHGTQYARCDNERMPSSKQTQQVWLERVGAIGTSALKPNRVPSSEKDSRRQTRKSQRDTLQLASNS